MRDHLATTINIIFAVPARVAPGNSHLTGVLVDFNNAKDILRIQTNETMAYKLLIEACRVSDEDMRVARGALHLDKSGPKPKYIGGHSFAGLQSFIAMVQPKTSVLPPWWGPSSSFACEGLAKEMYHCKCFLNCPINDLRRLWLTRRHVRE